MRRYLWVEEGKQLNAQAVAAACRSRRPRPGRLLPITIPGAEAAHRGQHAVWEPAGQPFLLADRRRAVSTAVPRAWLAGWRPAEAVQARASGAPRPPGGASRRDFSDKGAYQFVSTRGGPLGAALQGGRTGETRGKQQLGSAALLLRGTKEKDELKSTICRQTRVTLLACCVTLRSVGAHEAAGGLLAMHGDLLSPCSPPFSPCLRAAAKPLQDGACASGAGQRAGPALGVVLHQSTRARGPA